MIDPNAIVVPAEAWAFVPLLAYFVMQLRKSRRLELWLHDFWPLVAIVLGIITAMVVLGMQIKSGIYVGFAIGMASTGAYELGKGAAKHNLAKLPNGIKSASMGLLFAAIFIGGCSPKIKVTSEYDAHVRNTQSKAASYYEKCISGDPNACQACLKLAAAECDYITAGLNDPNKPITADKESTDWIKVRQTQLEWLSYKCDAGDANACKSGAVGGNRFLILFLNAVDDVNSTVKF